MKKKLSAALAVILVFATLFSLSAFAASMPGISSSKPIITYTKSSSGRVYAYTSANLYQKTGGYIACSTDQCKIIEIRGNAVRVTYPVSRGTKTAWFPRSAFTNCNIAYGSNSTFTAKTSATVYKWSGSSSKLGSIYVGDYCYLLSGGSNSSWCQVIYPAGSSYKMGWVKGSDYKSMTTKSNFTVIQQRDYGNIPYEYYRGDGKTISSSGCGVVTLANAVRWLNCSYSASSNYDLINKMAKAVKNAGARGKDGTSVETMVKSSSVQNMFGFKYHSVVGLWNRSKLDQTLNGKTVGILGMSNKYLNGQSGNHIVAVVDYDASRDEFLMLDSYMISSHKYNKNGNTAFWIPASKIDCNNIFFISKR